MTKHDYQWRPGFLLWSGTQHAGSVALVAIQPVPDDERLTQAVVEVETPDDLLSPFYVVWLPADGGDRRLRGGREAAVR